MAGRSGILLLMAAGATGQEWKINFGPTAFQLDGWANAGNPGGGSSGQDTTYGFSWSSVNDGPEVSVQTLGTRDYGGVQGPYSGWSNMLRTFVFGNPEFPQDITISNLEPSRSYRLRIFGHDTSTDTRHPHHAGSGGTFTVIGSEHLASRFVRYADRGSNPAVGELAEYNETMVPDSQGRIVIRYTSRCNGLIITLINSRTPTAAPSTRAPTPAPTPWHQHANFSVLADRIAALETLEARMTAVENNDEAEALRRQVATLNSTVLRQGRIIEQMRSAILDVVDDLRSSPDSGGGAAPTACTRQPCTPTVVANGNRLTVRSPGGAVELEDATCGTFNPCQDRMATNRTLERILNALAVNLALV